MNYTVLIRKVDWIDRDGLEADILFEISGKVLWAFCQPCDFEESEIATVSFSFLEKDLPEVSFWKENKYNKKEIVSFENIRGYYNCYGQIIDIQPVIIDCGIIIFFNGNWINDKEAIGKYVYFTISRLDVSRA
jgi:hypothetical protein